MPHPHPSTIERSRIGAYWLRGLRYQRTAADDDCWRGTVMRDDRRVAQVTSAHRHGPVDVDFVTARDRAQTTADAVQWDQAQPMSEDDPELALEAFVLALAEKAYHARQLQVQARVHTLFRLAGDPPDRFRTLRHAPYTTANEGRLRLMFGQRLVEVVGHGTSPE